MDYAAHSLPPTVRSNVAASRLSRTSTEREIRHQPSFKRDAYFALGVQQVWLVDWRGEQVEVCTARGVSHSERECIEWRTRADIVVRIELSEVFAGL